MPNSEGRRLPHLYKYDVIDNDSAAMIPSEPVYWELGGNKMKNGSCVRKLFFKTGRSKQRSVVSGGEQ